MIGPHFVTRAIYGLGHCITPPAKPPHMTSDEAVLARIFQGPAAMCDLACAVHVQCGIAPSAMYPEAYRATQRLIASGRIVAHISGAYMLPAGVPIEKPEEAPKGVATARDQMTPEQLKLWKH